MVCFEFKNEGERGPRTFMSDLQQIMRHSCDKSILSNGENETDLIHLFVNFLKKCEQIFLCLLMMKNIHGELKIEFLHYNCFPAIRKKLIVGLHHMLQNPVEIL